MLLFIKKLLTIFYKMTQYLHNIEDLMINSVICIYWFCAYVNKELLQCEYVTLHRKDALPLLLVHEAGEYHCV